MSINRYDTKRDANEKPIVQMMRVMGATVYPLDQPLDLLVGWRGKTYLAEVKIEKAKLNAKQQQFVEQWNGFPIPILRSPDEAAAWLQSLPEGDS